MDLKEALITRLGDGPGHRPVAERIAAGKAARRRRRAVVAVGCLTAVVVLGGAAYTSVALVQRDSAAPDRTATGPRVDSAPTAVVEAPERAWPEVILDARATLYVPADAEVVSTIENPLGVSAPLHSVAVELEYDGQPGWFIEVHEGEGTSGFAATAEEHQEFSTFEAWVKARSADLVKARRTQPDQPMLVNGEVQLPEGARLIQQVDTRSAPASRSKWAARSPGVSSLSPGGPMTRRGDPSRRSRPGSTTRWLSKRGSRPSRWSRSRRTAACGRSPV